MARRMEITIAAAAAARGVSEQTIKDAIKRGALVARVITPPETPPNRRLYRISKASFAAYKRRVATAKSPLDYPCDPDVYDRRRAEGWMTLTEASRLLGVSRQCVDSLVRRSIFAVEREGIAFVRRDDVQARLDRKAMASLDDALASL